jgi:uncharacterized protein YodC (DUF2158 family)
MENNAFKPGDIVMIKSGSPKMTVSYSDKDVTVCHFYCFTENKININNRLETIILERVDSES